MKRKAFLAALVCAFLLLGSFSACAEAAGSGRMAGLPSLPSQAQNSGIYDGILQKYYDVLYADWYMLLTAEDIEDMGLCYMLAYLHEDEKALVGYYLQDINGDGIDELFIGSNTSSTPSSTASPPLSSQPGSGTRSICAATGHSCGKAAAPPPNSFP